MQIDVITIFPSMFAPVLGASLLHRAQARGLLRMHVHDLRAYTHDKHRTVDDRPYGGGPGMVMKPEPIAEALEAIQHACARPQGRSAASCQTILMSPQGQPLSPSVAQGLARCAHLTLICGHYEGVDERVKLSLADRAISIGDYVLTGGELPAMVLIDAVSRFIPGVIGHARATEEESFMAGLLEYPQYTRPPVFRGLRVPTVLRSGNHTQVARWRKLQSVARTMTMRPDLVAAPNNMATPPRRRSTMKSSRTRTLTKR